MIKILHFADAHIDMANFGQHDPKTGLPLRVMDFLKSLDLIVETAIKEKVDLVIFAGDTYRDRNPAPTFQREWGRRMMKLSRASIPTILLTGNHDISPAQLRAHSMQEFETLEPEFIHVVSKPTLLHPDDLDGVAVQVIAFPWITRAGMMGFSQADKEEQEDPNLAIEKIISEMLEDTIQQLDPHLPTILTAHASIAGAKYGNENSIMIGKDVVFQPGLVRNPNFDYVALGHIHKYQNLNEGAHPPVIYPGSIERVDFGEVHEEKGFVIANVSKGHTDFEWRRLPVRKFILLDVNLEDDSFINEQVLKIMPSQDDLKEAIVRLTLHYPKDFEVLIDETRIRDYFKSAFEFKLTRDAQSAARVRLEGGEETSNLPPLELLERYWKQNHLPEEERQKLATLADSIISQVNSGDI